MNLTSAKTTVTRTTHKSTFVFTSLLLAGSIALSGCATDSTADLSTESTGASVASESSTGTDSASTTTSAADTAETTETSSTAATLTDTAAAAEAFMETLTAEQVETLTYDYADETKTTSWSNFPVTLVERAGLNLNDLTEEQKDAAMLVLEGLLSEEGYATAVGIIEGDQFLLEESTTTDDSLGQYYIAFFGEPSETEDWALQFGGHHLGINATLENSTEAITFAPTHLGSQPAVYTDSEGNEVQPLGQMYESAFAFYDSLTEDQRSALYQGEALQTMACAPGGTCDYPTGTGLSGADLSDEQRQLLLDLIENWVGLADAETTADALEKIEETLDETYINWSGETQYDMTSGNGIYFQISGPNAYIEFASQQGSAGADVDGYITSGWGHVHTIYRDPSNDYADSATQQEGSGIGGGAGVLGAPASPAG